MHTTAILAGIIGFCTALLYLALKNHHKKVMNAIRYRGENDEATK